MSTSPSFLAIHPSLSSPSKSIVPELVTVGDGLPAASIVENFNQTFHEGRQDQPGDHHCLPVLRNWRKGRFPFFINLLTL